MLNLEGIHHFSDLIGLVRNSRRQSTKQHSYRQLADKLGYRSPRTLAMVHKGQRTPSYQLVRQLIRHLSPAPHEIELILLLAEKSIAEKKQISTLELEERIAHLQKRIGAFKNLDFKKSPAMATLFLDASDLERINKIFSEIVETYGEKNISKNSFTLTISIDSS